MASEGGIPKRFRGRKLYSPRPPAPSPQRPDWTRPTHVSSSSPSSFPEDLYRTNATHELQDTMTRILKERLGRILDGEVCHKVKQRSWFATYFSQLLRSVVAALMGERIENSKTVGAGEKNSDR